MVLKGEQCSFGKEKVTYGASLPIRHPLLWLSRSLPNHTKNMFTSFSMVSFIPLAWGIFPFPLNLTKSHTPDASPSQITPPPAHSSVVSYPSGFLQYLLSDLHNFSLTLFAHFILVLWPYKLLKETIMANTSEFTQTHRHTHTKNPHTACTTWHTE